MNDKVKKVLKYLSFGLVGFLLGISTLILVSSCNQRNNNTSIELDNKKSLVKKSEDINYFLLGETFTFSPNFNYNAFFQNEAKSYLETSDIYARSKYPFIAFGPGSNEGSANHWLYIDTPGFSCQGVTYNRFKVSYFMAGTELNFYDVDNNIVHSKLIDNVNYYIYFTGLSYQYYNSTTKVVEKDINVCKREAYNNEKGAFVNYDATWVSNSYRTITSESDEWFSEYRAVLMILEMCNNFSDISGFDYGVSDVGLGSVFTLLTSAFYSLIPFLSIQIIPGITLGLLLFIPLIVSIISLVVWLVKK